MIAISSELGGPIFVFAVLILNTAFLTWEKMQAHVMFHEAESKSIVSQACANIIDATGDVIKKSENLLSKVDRYFKRLRLISLYAVRAAVVIGFAILYFGLVGKWTILILIPLVSYQGLSFCLFKFFKSKANTLNPRTGVDEAEASKTTSGKSSPPDSEELCDMQAQLIAKKKIS